MKRTAWILILVLSTIPTHLQAAQSVSVTPQATAGQNDTEQRALAEVQAQLQGYQAQLRQTEQSIHSWKATIIQYAANISNMDAPLRQMSSDLQSAQNYLVPKTRELIERARKAGDLEAAKIWETSLAENQKNFDESARAHTEWESNARQWSQKQGEYERNFDSKLAETGRMIQDVEALLREVQQPNPGGRQAVLAKAHAQLQTITERLTAMGRELERAVDDLNNWGTALYQAYPMLEKQGKELQGWGQSLEQWDKRLVELETKKP